MVYAPGMQSLTTALTRHLKEELHRRHITITAAADTIGISRRTLGQYLNEKVDLPLPTATALAKILDTPLSAIMRHVEDAQEGDTQ